MPPGRRLLFSAVGGHGHLDPLLPLAHAAAAAGHVVLVTAAAALREHVTAQGLDFVPTGPDLSPVRGPLRLHGLDHERAVIGSHFVATLGHERAAAVLALARSWRPDVVVRDEVDVGAGVAAERLGLGHAAVVVLAAGGLMVPQVVEAPLHDLRRAFGLPVGDPLAMLHGQLTLTPFPPAYRDPAFPLPGRVVAYRSIVAAAPTYDPPSEAVAHVTLGTVFPTESGDLLSRLVAGAAACADVDRVVVTTGPHVDVDELGVQPAHVAVHQFVPQAQVLDRCSAVISHAGSGTVLAALSRGLPQVCVPIGADQPLNAARCERLGASLTLRADAVEPADIAAALSTVVTDPRYRRAAVAMREEWLRLPDVGAGVDAVLALAR